MEHHGPTSWLLLIPGLSHDSHYIHVNAAILLVAFILVFSILAYVGIRRGIAQYIVPSSRLSIVGAMDLLVDSIRGMVVAVLGHDGDKHLSFLGTIFIFVWFSNLMGLLPLSSSPSASINTTAAIGLCSFVYYNFMGIKSHGVVGYFKHFLMGLGFMGVPVALFEILSHVVRPATLGLRLMLNLDIDHRLASTFGSIYAWLLPVPLLLFGIVVCTIQAFLFVTLTSVYLQMATEHEEEHH